MTTFTPEMIEKARQAKTPEELAELAKAENIDMTAEEAAEYFAQLNPKTGELSDDELENVSGGGCGQRSFAEGYPWGFTSQTVVTRDGEWCSNCFFGKYQGYHFYVDWVDLYKGTFVLRCKWCGSKGVVRYTGDPAKHGVRKI